MEEETGTTPDALKNRPALDSELLHFYRIWKDLAGSRHHSFGGPEPIPFSEVCMWGLAHGYSRLEIPNLWQQIAKIDAAWLTEVAKSREAQQEKPA